jgi:hypothetical protein
VAPTRIADQTHQSSDVGRTGVVVRAVATRSTLRRHRPRPLPCAVRRMASHGTICLAFSPGRIAAATIPEHTVRPGRGSCWKKTQLGSRGCEAPSAWHVMVHSGHIMGDKWIRKTATSSRPRSSRERIRQTGRPESTSGPQDQGIQRARRKSCACARPLAALSQFTH